MLVELSIANLAIIESIRLPFGPGLTVLTGETGAGKSIVIDAVMLLLGGRASSDLIRTGCDVAVVEGVFSVTPALRERLAGLEVSALSDDGEELILRREVSRERRSACRVNGRAVTLALLDEIGRHLIDIHGQGEHLSLLQVRNHVDVVDRYGGLLAQRESLAALVQGLRAVRDRLSALRQDKREMARRADLLAYQVDEIDAAHLRPGEEEDLRRRRALLANAERRQQLASRVHSLLSGDEERGRSLTDLVAGASQQLGSLAQLDGALRGESEQLEAILYQAEELARTLRLYRDGVEVDPRGLEGIEERLELIQSLKRKYGDDIPAVLAYRDNASAELDGLTHAEERNADLEREEARLLSEVARHGVALSEGRRLAAALLCQAIEGELADLNMARARFQVDIRWEADDRGVAVDGARYRFDASGLDRVEFQIAPNPGEDLKGLARIASGGETSRLLLAMKAAFADIDPVPTLIFDEIDSGIGGHTGDVVGRKLRALARGHQVFCVTHLPQIARYARQHVRIAKEVMDGRTVSSAHELTGAERVEELAVMLGGVSTEATRASAAELLRAAED